MKSPRVITLDGNSLTTHDVLSAVRTATTRVRLSPAARGRMQKAKRLLDASLTSRIIYGVNTGFGPMASHIIGRDDLLALQRNLIRSHASGVGTPIEPDQVLAAMMIRLNTIAKGHSGASLEVARQLERFINERITPIIPEHGAVGTSGDLVQLSHIALALIGEGEVVYRGTRTSTASVFKRLAIKPLILGPKEGLALINGTAGMTGISALACEHAAQLIALAVRTGAWALDLVAGYDDGINARLHAVRPHTGQRLVADAMRTLVTGSKRLKNRGAFLKKHAVAHEVHTIGDDVQEMYSLRCIPQILGPVVDAFRRTHGDVTTEMNSATDNPIIDWERGDFLHGGNFHGEYIGAAIDYLKTGIIKLTMLSERRINYFLNAAINRRLPPFLNMHTPGLTLGLQGMQFVATSTAAHSQSMAFPHHIHSIPTNADNQDVVSMGFDAARIAMNAIENAYAVLAIEMLTMAQATDALACSRELSPEHRALYTHIRKLTAVVREDRSLAPDLARIVAFLKSTPSLTIPSLRTP
jgi:histidine ammonia-lyase